MQVGGVGICFGGGMGGPCSAAGEPRLAAAVPFYGPAPEAPTSAANGRRIAVYGDSTTGSTPPGSAAAAALEAAG